MRFYILSLVLISLLSFKAQNSYEKLILGRWNGTKKETKNGNGYLRNGKPNKELAVYEFLSDKTIIDYTFAPEVSKYSYSIKNDILTLGKIKFKIEKIDAKELILLDYNEKNPKSPLVFRHYFVKK